MNNQHWNIQEMPSSCKLVHVKTCVERTKGEQTRNIRILKKLNRTQYRRLKKGKVKLEQLKKTKILKKTFERTTSKITENKTNATNEMKFEFKKKIELNRTKRSTVAKFWGYKNKPKKKTTDRPCKKKEKKKAFWPVFVSYRILDVIIFPHWENSFSRSCWVIDFGNPLIYKLAPFILSLLGLAYDT